MLRYSGNRMLVGSDGDIQEIEQNAPIWPAAICVLWPTYVYRRSPLRAYAAADLYRYARIDVAAVLLRRPVLDETQPFVQPRRPALFFAPASS
ncbi:hypothetical protein D3H35_00970 [Cohnella faecalis]|uniref:Uncharacterized protein n=1 Tax=Cohnella faecalis TaxID=2315694 RepID=A0A398CXX4_9BACL|nr:hypothetical protein D3H35_00970 [Cohnella faecalis]